MTKKWKPPIITYIVLYLFVIFFAIQFSSVIAKDDNIFEMLKKYNDLIIKKHRFMYIRINGVYSLNSFFIANVLYVFYIMFDLTKNRNFMPGREHGNAQWADINKINKKFEDKLNPKSNRVYSKNIRIGMNGKKNKNK